MSLDALTQNHGTLKTDIKAAVKDLQYITLDSRQADLIIEAVKGSDGKDIQIYSKNDYVVWKGTEPSSEDIIDEIKRYLRVNFIRGLEMENEELKASFSFVPVQVIKEGTRTSIGNEIPLEKKINDLGTTVFKDGDHSQYTITNNSKKTIYFTLLDIQPNNEITVLIPEPGRTAEEYYLRRGESFRYKNLLKFGDPFGTEMFKLITSEEPLNLGTIISNRGMRGKGDVYNNPFELLLEDSFKSDANNSRSITTVNIPSGDVNIISTTFEIQE